MAISNNLTLAIVLVNALTIAQLCWAALPLDLQNKLKDPHNDPNKPLSDLLTHKPLVAPPVNTLVNPPVKNPVNPLVNNPITPVVNKPVTPQPTNPPVNNPLTPPVNPPIINPITPPVNNPLTQTVNKPVTPPINPPNPITPPVNQPLSPLNSLVILHEDPNEFLIPQNMARAKVGLPPLVWNESLVEFARSYAQERANDCKLQHSHSPGKGENIARSPGILSPEKAVEMWVAEEPNYDYGSNTCKKVCGHYTQVVWKDTKSIGCARSNCQNRGTFVTCNYYPPGNVGGRKPY